MREPRIVAEFGGRILIVGFGCIGRGVLPLLLRHLGLRPGAVRIATDKDTHRDLAEAHGIPIRVEALTRENYRVILARGACAPATSC